MMKKISLLCLVLLFLASCIIYRNHAFDPYKSHHTADGFRNTQVGERVKKRGVMRWLQDLFIENISAGSLKSLPAIVKPDLDVIHNTSKKKSQLTWIGHSTFLIQLGTSNILTDPIFSRRASPLPILGPRRKVPVGLSHKEMPEVDIVLISHDHYDHLDINTIRTLGNDVLYLVPLGLKRWFNDKGFTNVYEFDWWETKKISGIQYSFVPAQHFSGRLILDLNKTLWGGWVVKRADKNLFFAGDTGYTKEFRELGARMGPFDISLLPIGAYAPRDVLRFVHIDPFDAVRIHKEIKSTKSVAMHWGTFRLTTEPLSEPPVILDKARRKFGIKPDEFVVLDIGQTLKF